MIEAEFEAACLSVRHTLVTAADLGGGGAGVRPPANLPQTACQKGIEKVYRKVFSLLTVDN